jgi:hypothetical protein
MILINEMSHSKEEDEMYGKQWKEIIMKLLILLYQKETLE